MMVTEAVDDYLKAIYELAGEEGDLLRAITERHDAQRVARELRADHVRHGQRDTLRGRESIFPVQHHRVTDVEQ